MPSIRMLLIMRPLDSSGDHIAQTFDLRIVEIMYQKKSLLSKMSLTDASLSALATATSAISCNWAKSRSGIFVIDHSPLSGNLPARFFVLAL